MSVDTRRYHRIIENTVDMFIDMCQKIVKSKGLEKKVWITKDEQASLVTIGNPDKGYDCKDFGFVFYYEMIVGRNFGDVIDEFNFKLDHFIKHANATGRFSAFKTDDDKEQK